MRKGVIKMKKLIMVVMAIAMVVAFMPIAEATHPEVVASDRAQLGLEVTFDLANEPLKISTYPEGPFKVGEDKKLYFTVTAKDPDARSVTLNCVDLPKGAMFILGKPFVPANSISGTFSWTPTSEQGQDKPYRVVFMATSSTRDVKEGSVVDENDKLLPPYEEARLVVEITVIDAEPVISIELNETSWKLDAVKLGERRNNNGPYRKPIHYIKNTGNVPVLVDIGYGLHIYPSVMGIVRPGLVQGMDTFTTAVGVDTADGKGVIIPPNERVKVAHIATGSSEGLPLTYGAPTGLSRGFITNSDDDIAANRGMSATYELRAYGNIRIDPDTPVTQEG